MFEGFKIWLTSSLVWKCFRALDEVIFSHSKKIENLEKQVVDLQLRVEKLEELVTTGKYYIEC